MRALHTFIVFLVMGFGGTAAQAYTNQEFCESVHGAYTVVEDEISSVEVCTFEKAMISVDTLIAFYERGHSDPWPEAIDAFAQRHFGKGGWESSESVCGFFEGGVERSGDHLFCVFLDDSFIELETLFSGVAAKENAGLKYAIQLTLGGE